ncbi:hypothetical protein U1707_07710 [Sphingomonas sp. PB2P12]|uniref:hypothetical protein n=1 Tax=Sphingomonas sandaracina TaxID=3096157 RepID=UPI002FCBB5EE
MRRPIAPLWLTTPSRFTAISQSGARATLALFVAIIVATWLALAVPPALHWPGADHGRDMALYAGIVDGVRHGGTYYAVAADAMRAGDYPMKPFVTMRLPTLAVTTAAMPSFAVVTMLYALAIATMIAWYGRLQAVLTRPALAIAMILLLGGMLAFFQSGLMLFHEIWAGLLIALSLAMHRPGRWIEAVAFGLAAVLIRETAAPYLALMAAFAFVEGSRREAAAWMVSLVIIAIVLVLHAHAVSLVVRPLDPASQGWAGMLGFGFVIRAIVDATALSLFPLAIAAPLVGVALFGWTTWHDPLATRMAALLAGYSVMLGLFGRLDTFYWALLIAPVSLVGMVFAVDGLRDLVRAARDSRRITVTRIIR